MIVIAIVISIVFIVILGMIIKAYFDDIVETNNRIQVLEKIIQDQYKDFSNTINDLKNDLVILDTEKNNQERRIEKIEKTIKKNKRDISKNNWRTAILSAMWENELFRNTPYSL